MPGHDADALRLDENLAFVADLGADRFAEIVVGADEPFAVPAVLMNDLLHLRGFGQITRGFRSWTAAFGRSPPAPWPRARTARR